MIIQYVLTKSSVNRAQTVSAVHQHRFFGRCEQAYSQSQEKTKQLFFFTYVLAFSRKCDFLKITCPHYFLPLPSLSIEASSISLIVCFSTTNYHWLSTHEAKIRYTLPTHIYRATETSQPPLNHSMHPCQPLPLEFKFPHTAQQHKQHNLLTEKFLNT